jgi:excisionase family DNA binding protein
VLALLDLSTVRHLRRALALYRRQCRTDAMRWPAELEELSLALAAPDGIERQESDDTDDELHHDDVRRLLTYRQTADRLGVGERTVRSLVKRGDLRAVAIGRSRRVDVQDADAYVDSLKAKGAA